jgi:hypothetical protein
MIAQTCGMFSTWTISTMYVTNFSFVRNCSWVWCITVTVLPRVCSAEQRSERAYGRIPDVVAADGTLRGMWCIMKRCLHPVEHSRPRIGLVCRELERLADPGLRGRCSVS